MTDPWRAEAGQYRILSEKTGWSYGKSAARLSSPQTLTLAELDLIFRRFHVDKDEAITAIQKGIKA